MHQELFFCKKCLAVGFHSILHQLKPVLYCPYHPEEILTRKCPECSNVYSQYGIGFQEEAFTCQSCKKSILKNESFIYNKRLWKYKFPLKFPLLDFLSLKKIKEEEISFVFPVEYPVSDINRAYSRIPYMINTIYQNCELPYCYDKKRIFQLAYPGTNERHLGYNLKALMKNRPKHSALITDSLNQVLYDQSKAILKSVERYILKQLDENTRKQIKSCYGKNGFKESSKYKNPFIEWKNECYGDWIYNLQNWKTVSYNHKLPIYDYNKQIYPYLRHSASLQNIMDIQIANIKSFSTLINVFSKLLFHFSREK